MAKGYGNLPSRLKNRYMQHMKGRSSGPHDPKNARAQALADLYESEMVTEQDLADFMTEPSTERQIFLVRGKLTSGDDMTIRITFDRQEAEEEASKLALDTKYRCTWYEIYYVEMP